MCTENVKAEMAGLHPGHVSILKSFVPELSELTEQLYAALTQKLKPHLPVLPAILAMVEAVQKRDYGVLQHHNLARLPLSVIGNDAVRYRTPVVDWLHESVLSFRMAELTVNAVKETLRQHDICILFLCSCGIVMGRCSDVRAFYNSEDHQRMDRLRSAIDAAGHPVAQIKSFDDIRVPTMDLHANGAEVRTFDRIEYLTLLAAQAGHADYSWIQSELTRFVSVAQSKAPSPTVAA